MIKFSIVVSKKNSKCFKIDINKVVEQICCLVNKNIILNSDKFFDINIVSAKQIHKINKQYRNVDEPTDVISFAFCDNKEIQTPLLGEIYVCYEIAMKQANDFDHSFQRELIFLITHGLLHLLGFDHENKKNEQKMLKLTYKIINDLNIDEKYKKGKNGS